MYVDFAAKRNTKEFDKDIEIKITKDQTNQDIHHEYERMNDEN